MKDSNEQIRNTKKKIEEMKKLELSIEIIEGEMKMVISSIIMDTVNSSLKKQSIIEEYLEIKVNIKELELARNKCY